VNVRAQLKFSILASITLIFLGVHLPARAATQPLPGEYIGEWRGPNRGDGFGVETQSVRVIISTNREVVLLMTFVNRITGAVVVDRFDGTVRRNGTIRGGDEWGKFRAAPREKGRALRGTWYFPTRHGPANRVRFHAVMNE